MNQVLKIIMNLEGKFIWNPEINVTLLQTSLAIFFALNVLI